MNERHFDGVSLQLFFVGRKLGGEERRGGLEVRSISLRGISSIIIHLGRSDLKINPQSTTP